MVVLASLCSLAIANVLIVVLQCSDQQMIWINAKTIVARMSNDTVKQRKRLVVLDCVSRSMCGDHAAPVKSNFSVPVSILAFSPFNAAILTLARMLFQPIRNALSAFFVGQFSNHNISCGGYMACYVWFARVVLEVEPK